jgi:hypothetical protein
MRATRGPASAEKSGASRHQRRFYRYAIALVLACASIIALVLLYVDRSVSVKDKATQIGSGLAASIIFAVIYTILANKEFSELIRSEISTQLASHINDTLHQIMQLNQLYLPTNQYPAGREFDVRFNSDLTRDLSSSSYYFFRGTSAKYVPARLRQCDHRLQLAQVMLLDPRDGNAIEARAKDRRKRPEHGGKALLAIEHEMRSEILLALVALFDCRETCEIELGFSATSSPVRVEIFDDAIYTSFYRSAESQRNTHPETVRFSKDSQTYQIFQEECRRQLQFASPRRHFTAHDSDQDLCNFAATLGFADVGADELAKQRALYQEFITPFSNALRR